MATDFTTNAVITAGGIKPSMPDMPGDIRTRINSIDEVESIPLPFVGMIFYVVNEDNYYSVKSLKSNDIGNEIISNAIIDEYDLLGNLIKATDFIAKGAFSMNRYYEPSYNSTREAIGSYSSTFGYYCAATASYSFAEGYYTQSLEKGAHAEGNSSIASKTYSHAEGIYTQANCSAQHVQGKYNIVDYGDKYAHIIGNGSSDSRRSNAHTVDWNGNAWYAGDVYIGADNNKLATEKQINDLMAIIESLQARIEELENK